MVVDYGKKFRGVAQAVIAKFAEAEGKGKLIRVANSYSTVTGITSVIEIPEDVYIVFDEINLGNVSSEYGAEYIKETMLALIAGSDLSAPPKMGDLVQRQNSTDKHKIVMAPVDMYGALYTCHVTRKVVEP